MDKRATVPHRESPFLLPGKFADPDRTLSGEVRASVPLSALHTLWINTGSLCNIACVNCYIESSPRNDQLEYFTAEDAEELYDEIAALGLNTREIAFTGGEPFMNPHMLAMAQTALERGFAVLVLTNAMQPMQRPRVEKGLLELQQRFGARLTLRVSLDHYTAALHETERGPGSWESVLKGLDWLSANGFSINVAGRTCWNETQDEARAGYAALFAERGYSIDAHHPGQLVLFPEMDERLDIAEITTACWDILGLAPSDIMCATSRMVVKRKGAARPVVLPCTLLPYDAGFEMGESLAEAARAHGGNFEHGAVKLNHPHCARFCVLGGGSCSVAE